MYLLVPKKFEDYAIQPTLLLSPLLFKLYLLLKGKMTDMKGVREKE